MFVINSRFSGVGRANDVLVRTTVIITHDTKGRTLTLTTPIEDLS